MTSVLVTIDITKYSPSSGEQIEGGESYYYSSYHHSYHHPHHSYHHPHPIISHHTTRSRYGWVPHHRLGLDASCMCQFTGRHHLTALYNRNSSRLSSSSVDRVRSSSSPSEGGAGAGAVSRSYCLCNTDIRIISFACMI